MAKEKQKPKLMEKERHWHLLMDSMRRLSYPQALQNSHTRFPPPYSMLPKYYFLEGLWLGHASNR